MMHRFLILLLLVIVVPNSHAQFKGFGIGIIFGEPTGISGKKWLTNTTAVDGGLAWSFIKGGSLHIHADYLWHTFDALKTEYTIPVYVGIGGRFKFAANENARLGVRIVGGLDFLFSTAPVDIFIEIAPIMDLIPATQLGLNGGIGARFFFK